MFISSSPEDVQETECKETQSNTSVVECRDKERDWTHSSILIKTGYSTPVFTALGKIRTGN